ncbi:putative apoptosis regulator BAX [Apostichopus japonicus]|uniref:Putative apoptosis regulator BAX n=1 Tax=Stichopus japonicus TaxID=307972 RepID=A0A2G8L437_STIJA|nr:putative apoptosis regulator BAX [Apostichopus japonicus]
MWSFTFSQTSLKVGTSDKYAVLAVGVTLQISNVLLQSFIVERFESEQVTNAPSLRELRDGEEEVDEELDESWRQVGGTFRQIAQSVDQSAEFQSVVATIPKDPSIEDIMCYVRESLSDGEINWGRIVALFCFAYQVCAKKFEMYMEKRFPNFPSWLTKLITAVVKFLLYKFADWIVNRGGWQSIQEYFGTPNTIWKDFYASHDDLRNKPPCCYSMVCNSAFSLYVPRDFLHHETQDKCD